MAPVRVPGSLSITKDGEGQAHDALTITEFGAVESKPSEFAPGGVALTSERVIAIVTEYAERRRPENAPLNITLRRLRIEGDLDLSRLGFIRRLELDGIELSGRLRLAGLKAGYVSIHHSVFGGGISLNSARIDSGLSVRQCVALPNRAGQAVDGVGLYCGGLSLLESVFLGQVALVAADIGDKLDLRRSRFFCSTRQYERYLDREPGEKFESLNGEPVDTRLCKRIDEVAESLGKEVRQLERDEILFAVDTFTMQRGEPNPTQAAAIHAAFVQIKGSLLTSYAKVGDILELFAPSPNTSEAQCVRSQRIETVLDYLRARYWDDARVGGVRLQEVVGDVRPGEVNFVSMEVRGRSRLMFECVVGSFTTGVAIRADRFQARSGMAVRCSRVFGTVTMVQSTVHTMLDLNLLRAEPLRRNVDIDQLQSRVPVGSGWVRWRLAERKKSGSSEVTLRDFLQLPGLRALCLAGVVICPVERVKSTAECVRRKILDLSTTKVHGHLRLPGGYRPFESIEAAKRVHLVGVVDLDSVRIDGVLSMNRLAVFGLIDLTDAHCMDLADVTFRTALRVVVETIGDFRSERHESEQGFKEPWLGSKQEPHRYLARLLGQTGALLRMTGFEYQALHRDMLLRRGVDVEERLTIFEELMRPQELIDHRLPCLDDIQKRSHLIAQAIGGDSLKKIAADDESQRSYKFMLRLFGAFGVSNAYASEPMARLVVAKQEGLSVLREGSPLCYRFIGYREDVFREANKAIAFRSARRFFRGGDRIRPSDLEPEQYLRLVSLAHRTGEEAVALKCYSMYRRSLLASGFTERYGSQSSFFLKILYILTGSIRYVFERLIFDFLVGYGYRITYGVSALIVAFSMLSLYMADIVVHPTAEPPNAGNTHEILWQIAKSGVRESPPQDGKVVRDCPLGVVEPTASETTKRDECRIRVEAGVNLPTGRWGGVLLAADTLTRKVGVGIFPDWKLRQAADVGFVTVLSLLIAGLALLIALAPTSIIRKVREP